MDIVITTGDIKQAYTIIHPIFVQITNKGTFKNQYEQLEIKYSKMLQRLQEVGLLPLEETEERKGSVAHARLDHTGHRMEKAFYIAIEEMRQRAEKLGGQAVVYMRYETDLLNNPNSEFYLQMYGTVVRYEADNEVV